MFLLSLSIYYARDSCKRWQENKDRLGLISRMTVNNFSSLFCFFCFLFSVWEWPSLFGWHSRKFLVTILFFCCFFLLSFGEIGSVRKRQPNISRHYYVFFPFFFSLFFARVFSFFLLYLLYHARDSCKKWQEKIDKLGLISRMDSFKNFSSPFCFLFFLFWCDWIYSDKTAKNFSSLFCFFFLFRAWLGLFG